jgi:hypothetical protein
MTVKRNGGVFGGEEGADDEVARLDRGDRGADLFDRSAVRVNLLASVQAPS